MAAAQRTFSPSPTDSQQGQVDEELQEYVQSLDPVGRLIDSLASMYGWSQEYILDQPYPRLNELQKSARLREYGITRRALEIVRLAQVTEVSHIQDFINNIKPKVTKKEASRDASEFSATPGIVGDSMDISSIIIKHE